MVLEREWQPQEEEKYWLCGDKKAEKNYLLKSWLVKLSGRRISYA
jgi:hypothetical protein